MNNPSHPNQTAPKIAGLAIASLVLGIVSFGCLLFAIASIPAVICGHIAINRIRKSQGTLTGYGLGVAGLILGYVNLTFSIVLIPLLLAIAVPNFVKARTIAQTNVCINNLRQLNEATDQWALENQKDEGDLVNPSDLDVYLKNGTASLKCPAGGEYTIPPVGELPTCSVERHQLPSK